MTDKRNNRINTMWIKYDQPVYADIELSVEKSGVHQIKNSTRLPKDVFFGNTKYTGQAKNNVGDVLFNVTFTYPDHVKAIMVPDRENAGKFMAKLGSEISVETGATYS